VARIKESRLPDEPLWYKNAVFYEVRVRSYFDSSGDGIGDFPGLTNKLDYLHELGVTVLWLLPFYPSPLRDDGYDISNYTDVHPDCGTLQDFRTFLREAHRRGIRVVTELVINHTSDQHPWFQRARRSPPGSRQRDFYIWNDTAERYREARIIFQDFELSNWTWDPVGRAYYFHRFYSHQPDLNFDNPEVRRATMAVLDFWLGLGVDGLRLDAVPYLYKREGTNCENLPETHAFLRELRAHVDRKFKNRMLLAEANQWPEDAVTYLGEKECHMAFHFPLMPRLFMAVRREDRFPITDIWAQTPPIDETCQWALFLRNHDELTLEMVTEEERDYMYRAYARESRMRLNLGIRRRLAPLLSNNRRTIELINALLFSMPGTPVVYYGDEIGMGDNVYLGDRDGVRTPMQWSGDRNAGFSTANPQQLILPVVIDYEYHYQTVNVEAQERNRHALLWWMRRLIALRKQHRAFGRGTMEILNPENPRVLAFVRAYQEERILVVANLSRFVQYVELDLSRFKGMVPVELFGHTNFPAIGDLPYLLTLGPHNFQWFSLEHPHRELTVRQRAEPHHIEAPGTWESFIRGEAREPLERALADYMPTCRWFRSKARNIRRLQIFEVIPVPEAEGTFMTMVNVEYGFGDPDAYVLPLGFGAGDAAGELRSRAPEQIVAELKLFGRNGAGGGVIFDAASDPRVSRALLDLVARHRHVRGEHGELHADATHAVRNGNAGVDNDLAVRPLHGEQTNTSIVLGDKLIVKLLRKLEEGVSPELEIGRLLAERSFAHTPELVGWLEYQVERQPPNTVAVIHRYVPNQGDAWGYTNHELRRFFERIATKKDVAIEVPAGRFVDAITSDEAPTFVNDLIGAYLDVARLLGRRTAELHLVLAGAIDLPAFAPEPYSTLYQRATYQSMRNLAGETFRLLRGRLRVLDPALRELASRLLERQDDINRVFAEFLKHRINAVRTRCHGDLHLGQILATGKDFMIIDFEGEPARTLSERQRKRSPLRDVAGMIRSFHYAALSTLMQMTQSGALGPLDFAVTEPWARLWHTWTSWAYLRSYLETAGSAPFAPAYREELGMLLNTFLLEKALYELGYELNNRPDWLHIPIHAVEGIAGGGAA
jgi:maltose alpha-D-glucosyltransferase/alpha-amylase